MLAGLLGVTGWSYWAVFVYLVLANFFFQVRLSPAMFCFPNVARVRLSTSLSRPHSSAPYDTSSFRTLRLRLWITRLRRRTCTRQLPPTVSERGGFNSCLSSRQHKQVPWRSLSTFEDSSGKRRARRGQRPGTAKLPKRQALQSTLSLSMHCARGYTVSIHWQCCARAASQSPPVRKQPP